MVLRGVVAKLEDNPRGVRVFVCRRSPATHCWSRDQVAAVDARTVRQVLQQPGALLLEVQLGPDADKALFRVKLRGDG